MAQCPANARLVFVHANQVWMFFTGTNRPTGDWSILKLEGEDTLFGSRSEAVQAARRRGLRVDQKDCVSIVREPRAPNPYATFLPNPFRRSM